MNQRTVLKVGGLIVGFFLLGQAVRSLTDGAPLRAGIGAFVGIAILLAAFRLDD